MTGYLICAAFIIGVICAYTAQEWRYGEQLAIIKAEQATELSKAYAEAQGLQDRQNARDKLAMEAIDDLQTKNDLLVAKYTGDNQRLRIKATCPVPNSAEAASVSNDSTAELSADTGRTVLNFRMRVEKLELMFSELQSWSSDVSGSKTDAPKN